MQTNSDIYLEIARTPSQKVRISLDDYHGKTFLNIRVWTLKDKEWIPTKRGIHLYSHEILKLEEAIQYAKEDLFLQ